MPKKQIKNIRVRFAPSPTGFLHIGGLRTALYNYLFAKKNKGKFILRVEDTDRARSVEGGVEAIVRALSRSSLRYDEGVFLKNGKLAEKGKYGPYIQSQRLKIYKKYADELLKKGKAYYCFCAEERLKEMRENQEKNHQPTMYDGRCKHLPKKEIEESLKKKIPYVIRMNVPDEGVTEFDDLIRGHVFFENKLIDDQVLMKSDGFPTYHLANVADDHLMKITHVIRGEEWLSSAPKHILLYNVFGWKAPRLAHIPLLLNSDRSKLSKRQGDVAVEDYLDKGYLPEALLNFIAIIGWNPTANKEIFSLRQLEKEFKLEDVNKSGAVFNTEKLDWLNGVYIRELPLAEFAKLCIEYLENQKYIKRQGKRFKIIETNEVVGIDWIKKAVNLEKTRIKTLSEITGVINFLFKKSLDYDGKFLIWKQSDEVETKKRLLRIYEFFEKIPAKNFILKKIEDGAKNLISKENLGVGDTLWPLRVALSGREKSPGPFEIAEVLGKEKVLKRIKEAIGKL